MHFNSIVLIVLSFKYSVLHSLTINYIEFLFNHFIFIGTNHKNSAFHIKHEFDCLVTSSCKIGIPTQQFPGSQIQ